MPDAVGPICSLLCICALEFLWDLILGLSPQRAGLVWACLRWFVVYCCYRELLQKVSQDCHAIWAAVPQGQAGNLRRVYSNLREGKRVRVQLLTKKVGADLNGNAEMMAVVLEMCLKSCFVRMRQETERMGWQGLKPFLCTALLPNHRIIES